MSREIENTTKAFRKARGEGEQMVIQGRITWDDYAFVMLGFEAELRQLGVDL